MRSNRRSYLNSIQQRTMNTVMNGMKSHMYGQWIPCSERLPEECVEVLVTREFLGCEIDGVELPPVRCVETAMLVGGKWILACEEDPKASQHHSQPLAWMPMPKAYLGKV